MNIEDFFNSLIETQVSLTAEQRQLIDTMMELNSPMAFDDDFATDEELDALEDAMDRAECEVPSCVNLKNVISSLPARKSNKDDFI